MRQPQFADLLPSLASGTRTPPEYSGEPTRIIPLRSSRLTIGRSARSDVVLADTAVCPDHAVLSRDGPVFRLADAPSRLGTFVNGRPAAGAPLEDGDLVQIGPYLFRFGDARLVWLRTAVPLTIAAAEVSQTAGSAYLLNGVSLLLRPGELVGLLGPSGCGKTTLLDALSGRRPAASGKVLFNGTEFYPHYDDLRRLVGYVPQDDIVHTDLTPRQALRYAGLLRLPPDLTRGELDRRVEAVLDALDLADQAEVPIVRLSGGQRKRASVGVELIGRPAALFLDEPTAGLDPGVARRLVRTCRGLAREGRVVVFATHVMEDIEQFDRVAVLAGGRLSYFGAPTEMSEHFGAGSYAEVYDRLEERPAKDLARQFAASVPGREVRAAVAMESRPQPLHNQELPSPSSARTGVRQWAVLSARFLRTLVADPSHLGSVFIAPLAIGMLTCLVFKELPTILFLLVVAAIWFGCGLAAQQVVKERPVYCRERMVGLRLGPYVLSKFVPLAVLGAAQCAILLGAVAVWKDGPDWWAGYGGLVLASWNGTAMGLLVSARASNPDRATAAVPTLMLPQIILAGVLIGLPDMDPPARVAAELAAAKWANRVMEVSHLDGRRVDDELLAEPSNVWPLRNLYPGYELREVNGRSQFLKDHAGQVVVKREELATACAMLTLAIAIQLWGVGWFLRARDPL